MNVTPDEIPKRVGRYEIVESVGFGAMGAVYKALDPLIDRTVAIKTIRLDVPPDSPHYQTFLQRFYTEARISGTLSHPNVVTLYDIGETADKIPFLAMEYIDGETVADMLASSEQLRPEQVVALVSQIAAAIDYAHGKGVIHRDIKPSNIIVFDGEKVKVTDFGIAKLMDAEGTQTASLLGTPSYMSPEQAMGEELDGRTDIFSLGVVAFEMLSGEQPFPGNNVTSILYKLVHSDPVRPTNLEIMGLLPDKWHMVFNKVLAKSPPERYQTAAEFVSNLELCLGSWFGALEGETVVMTSPETTVMDLGGLESEPTVSSEARENDSEETVLLESAETRTDIAPVPEQPPAASETLPSLNEQELETIALKSTPVEVETRTMERSSRVDPSEEPTGLRAPVAPSPGPQAPETETIALGSEETLAISPETEATLVPASEDETVAILTAEDFVPAGKVEPVTARNVKWLGSSRHLPAAVLAVVALVAVAVGAVYWLIGQPETPPVPFGPLTEPVPVTGTLTVRSDPEGATVLVDGEDRGVTPLELAELGLGIYTVRVEKEGFKPQELAAAINDDTNVATLDIALERVPATAPAPARAILDIQSTPSEARVLMDGQVIGKTPIERFLARPGRRTLLIQKEGFKPWETSIEVVAGVSGTVSASLEAIEEAPPPPPEKPPEPEVRIGDLVERGPDVIDPKCIECPNVPYPELAKNAGMEGVVEVSFTITETGTVQDIRIDESGGEMFDPAVINVLKAWRYQPATKQGIPVKVRLTRRFRFRRGR